ncbi:MAG: cell division topological specificity factor MinE [Gammaproteobacteria bacterium]|nr:cell division topological specificity factor MinE [Gammaproteobacteria bacterium]MBP9729208.1 cell division topological specificity factor MinE [Gammaproteobacteria bacterium]
MSILARFFGFGRQPQSASVARDRLQIVLSHQRNEAGDTDFLPKLRNELLEVLAKYVNVDKEQINVQLQRTENRSVLELNITLPGQ